MATTTPVSDQPRGAAPPLELAPQPAPKAPPDAPPWPAPAPLLKRAGVRLLGRLASDSEIADLVHQWPQSLVTLLDVAEAAIRAAPAGACASVLARCVVAAQALYLGGERIHFPGHEAVQRVLRDARIWREFDGRNVHDLARRYHLDIAHVYRILRTQRALRRRRRQPL